MDVVLIGGRVLAPGGTDATPGRSVDAALDVRIRDGKIVEIGRGLRGGRERSLGGALVVPGLVDLHVHLREPGHEYKEDIGSGTRAAVRGGFTRVCAMPNTNPVNDQRSITELIVRRAAEVGLAKVHPIGAISRGLEGKALADLGDMQAGGAVAVSDDGRPVMNAGLLRRAMEYARTFGLPVVQHAEDLDLSEGGAMNEGEVATRIGLKGQPACAESSMVARDLEIVAWTGARYHVAHASTKRTVELIRDGKRRGLPLTCEVTPHHLLLTDAACRHYDTNTKVMPPLRTAEDCAALLTALADGVIDAIATDHAPHSPVEKHVEFECAAPGMLGLETALPLILGLVRDGVIDLARAIHLMSWGPAQTFGLDRLGAGRLMVGGAADLAVIDPERTWVLGADQLASKSKNSPFLGQTLRGRALSTWVDGRLVHDLDGESGAGA